MMMMKVPLWGSFYKCEYICVCLDVNGSFDVGNGMGSFGVYTDPSEPYANEITRNMSKVTANTADQMGAKEHAAPPDAVPTDAFSEPVYQILDAQVRHTEIDAGPLQQIGTEKTEEMRPADDKVDNGVTPSAPRLEDEALVIYDTVNEQFQRISANQNSPTENTERTGGPSQYQELNYASNPNFYQPLSLNWKTSKYDHWVKARKERVVGSKCWVDIVDMRLVNSPWCSLFLQHASTKIVRAYSSTCYPSNQTLSVLHCIACMYAMEFKYTFMKILINFEEILK